MRPPSCAVNRSIMIQSLSFPPASISEKQLLILAIRKAKWADFEWKPLKDLYRKLEQQPDAELLAEVLFKLDNAPFVEVKDVAPTIKTLAYMKRRGARFLQKVAIKKPDLYLEICQLLLIKQHTKIDFNHQWIIAKILYGNSRRWVQKRHGRGSFVMVENQPNIYRSEERHFELWNEQKDFGFSLLNTPNLAVGIYEFAVKLLSRNQLKIPQLTAPQLAIAFQCNTPWLQKIASEQYFNFVENEGNANPQMLAYTYLYAPANHRKRIEEIIKFVPQPASSGNIIKIVKSLFAPKPIQQPTFPIPTFANMLLHILGVILPNRRATAKRISDATNLILQYAKLLDVHKIRNQSGILLNANLPKLDRLVFEKMEEANPKQPEMWLNHLQNVERKKQRKVFQFLENNLTHLRFSEQRNLVMNWCMSQQNSLVADYGWYAMHLWRNPEQERTAHRVFSNLFWGGWKSIRFQNAVKSEFGAILLVKYGKNWLSNARPELLMKIMQNAAPILQEEAKKIFLQRLKSNFFNLLPELAKMTAEREAIFQKIYPELKNPSFVIPTMSELLTAENEWIFAKSWQVFTEKFTKSNLIQQVIWQAVYRGEIVWGGFLKSLFAQEHPIFKTHLLEAFSSMIQQQPVFVKKLVPVFGEVSQSFDNETLIWVLEAVDATTWEQIQPAILTYLNSEKGTQLWLYILKNLNKENQESIFTQKILADATMQKTLLKVDSIEVLDCHQPSMEKVLLEWMNIHENLFKPNSHELLTVLTHRLSGVRNWGMEKVDKESINLRFALQLLESGLPEAATFGQAFFHQTPTGTQAETDHVLALLDSPDESTRIFGQAFFEQRKIHLNNPVAIACLTEHIDPKVQEFVAEELNQNIAPNVKRTFDRAVLRTKNKARSAKELVKKRVENDLEIDPSVLLELANGQNVKDREWAIEQLLKLTLSGVEVPEFALA